MAEIGLKLLCTVLILITYMIHYRDYIQENKILSVLSCIICIAGSFIYGIHAQLLWLLLIFHSYMDIVDRSIFYRYTLAGIGMEMVIMLWERNFYLKELSIIIITIVIIDKIGAVAQADAEIFLLLGLYGVNNKGQFNIYFYHLIFLSGLIFVIYMAAYNAIKLLFFKGCCQKKGAFVPAIAAAFFILEVYKSF